MTIRSTLLFIASILIFFSCKKDEEPVFDSKGYPEEIGQIMLNSCATSGCHNDISKIAAGGLSLSSWESMFEGSRGGSPVIPYRSDQSYFMFSINTDPNLGVTLPPSMPFNQDPLSIEEYSVIKEWIDNGAPNTDGLVKFSDNPNRRKFYVTNQGCDLVSVFDADSQILMRYIDVGSTDEIEAPHQAKVSPDGQYWYPIFFAGTQLQKFSAVDDTFVSEVEIGQGSWNTLRISSDSKYAYVVNWSPDGTVAVVDLEKMELIQTLGGNGSLEYPHGSLIDEVNDILYLTAQHGNFIYKLDIADINNVTIEKISLNGVSPTTLSWLDPHELEMSPDGSTYFVTCQESNEVRVLTTVNDSLVAVIPTGDYPQEMAISTSTPYLYVSCTEDKTTYPGKNGSVHIIDYTNYTLVKTLNTGYQPHGIAVDEQNQLVYVAHRNIDTNGPAPHHSTDCEGRNGYVSIIDMQTLEMLPDYKVEISVDPYSISVRN